MPKKSETKTEENAKVEETKTEEKPQENPSEETKKLSKTEYEKKVIELAKQGLTAEKIGEKLKKEGIHTKDYSKKISKILKENDLYENPDLKNVEAKFQRVSEHYKKNKQDKRAKREKDRFFSRLRKVKKYLKVPLK